MLQPRERTLLTVLLSSSSSLVTSALSGFMFAARRASQGDLCPEAKGGEDEIMRPPTLEEIEQDLAAAPHSDPAFSPPSG